MEYREITGKFTATPEKGEVSSLLLLPKEARWLLVLGHGASSHMRHQTLENIAHCLADTSIATFRYHFPYMERGGRGRDAQTVSLATVRSAIAAARKSAPHLPLFAGGHSFGGRMTSLAITEKSTDELRGLVFFSFPLHPAGKRGTERAAHLKKITVPMLFLSGTRDKLAELDLLQPICSELTLATLHLLDTADHGYKILKRSRQSKEDIFAEIARATASWAKTSLSSSG